MTDHGAKTVARLFDFLHRRTPWHRRLWSIGTVLGLLEVVEYSRVRREGNLPPDGLSFVAATMRREIALDPGAAPFAPALESVLGRPERLTAADEYQIEHLAHRVDDGYLTRWAEALRSSLTPSVERTARSLAAHLLDKGFSSDHLYRWLDADRHQFPEPDLERLFEQAATICRTTAGRNYQVLIPCFLPGEPSRSSEVLQWLDAHQTMAWLSEHQASAQRPRCGGAFLVTVGARDPWAAVEAASELVARVAARIQVGQPGGGSLRTVDVAFVAGNERTFKLQSPRRQLDVHALHREDAIYDVDPQGLRELDDALVLAAYLETGSAGAAVTGGWAAVESLLVYPGERALATAADRLAAIVACSIGRAELTPLTFAHQESGDDQLALSLKALGAGVRNYERVRLTEEHLRAGGTLVLRSASDRAALDRIVAMIQDGQGELGRIRGYLQEAFRRLYNQRNLVMHAGSFRSIALPVILRTGPPIVGAGLDRIAHSQLSAPAPTNALALAAKAETELSLLGTPGAAWLVDLLGS